MQTNVIPTFFSLKTDQVILEIWISVNHIISHSLFHSISPLSHKQHYTLLHTKPSLNSQQPDSTWLFSEAKVSSGFYMTKWDDTRYCLVWQFSNYSISPLNLIIHHSFGTWVLKLKFFKGYLCLFKMVVKSNILFFYYFF